MDSGVPSRGSERTAVCDHLGEAGTYCTKCWVNLYELRNAARDVAKFKMPLAILRLVGMCLTVLAAMLFVHSLVESHRYRWIPVREPMQLSEGAVVESTFEAQASESHRVELDFAGNPIEFERRQVLPGRSYDRNGCLEQSVLQTAWTVSSEGTPIPVRHWGNCPGPILGPNLGMFDAEKGKTYTVTVHILQDATILQRADPHLQVRLEPLFTLGISVGTSLELLVAIAVGLVGGGFLVMWSLRRSREHLSSCDGSNSAVQPTRAGGPRG